VLKISIPVPEAQSNLRQIPIQTTSASSQPAEQKSATNEANAGQKAA
jgi:hypothetical protein